MINILDLTIEHDIQLLKAFSELEHPPFFRYFKKRIFGTAIETHVVTLLYSTYGYAHIDKDANTGRHYLGICVLPEYQGNGVGKKLMETLFKLFTGELHITVDKENLRAILFYEKYGFKRIGETSTTYEYKKSQSFLVDVSVGEGVDKLTILDIKIDRITSEYKKSQCKTEYDSLWSRLNTVVSKYAHLYNWLKYINVQIWNLQDEIRENNKYSEKGFRDILDLNDMRFRVKKIINSAFESSFQEQKGYSPKTGVFLSNFGLEHLINMNGAIRYAALMVDNLYVICNLQNCKSAKEMFSDNPSITIVECKDDAGDVREIVSRFSSVSHSFVSGVWRGEHVVVDDTTSQFYDQLGFPIDIKTIFAYFPSV